VTDPDDPAAPDNGPARVVLGPSLTLQGVAGLKQRLARAFSAGGTVYLDGAGVTSVDTAGIQLLVAFCLEARTRGAAVIWQGASEAVKRSAARLGLGAALGLATAIEVP
jgi:anti-anti-sigma regulatory factor